MNFSSLKWLKWQKFLSNGKKIFFLDRLQIAISIIFWSHKNSDKSHETSSLWIFFVKNKIFFLISSTIKLYWKFTFFWFLWWEWIFWKIENFKNFHEFWSYQLQKFFGDSFYSKVTPKKFWSCQLHFFGKNSIFFKIFFLVLGYTTFFCSFLAFFFFEKWQIWRSEVAQLQKKFFWKNFRVYVVHPLKALSVSQIFISVIQKEKEWRFFPRTVPTCKIFLSKSHQID